MLKEPIAEGPAERRKRVKKEVDPHDGGRRNLLHGSRHHHQASSSPPPQFHRLQETFEGVLQSGQAKGLNLRVLPYSTSLRYIRPHSKKELSAGYFRECSFACKIRWGRSRKIRNVPREEEEEGRMEAFMLAMRANFEVKGINGRAYRCHRSR